MTRRTFAAGALLTAACGRRLAQRYFGWLYVASAAERSVAVADLSEFRRAGSIPLPSTPAQILTNGHRVFVTCPEAHSVFEIDTARHQLGTRVDLGGRIVSALLAPDSPDRLVAATAQPNQIVVADLSSRRILTRIPLPAEPGALDTTAATAAVAMKNDGRVARASLSAGRLAGLSDAGSRCAALRFRNDGQALLAAAVDTKQIVTFDVASGALLAKLPLAFAPASVCFTPDTSQMFVAGGAQDSIAIVYTYQSQVDQTIVAGRMPGSMAVSPERNLLLVTNPPSGDLTILDIETRSLASSVHVGGNPGPVLVTPDEQFALVINRDSGDVAVVRLNTVIGKSSAMVERMKPKPLFTMFATAPGPQSAAIVAAEV